MLTTSNEFRFDGLQPARNEPGQVEISFEGPRPQRRATIAFRLLLVVPHLICLLVIGFAAYVVAVIGWFVALFTGELPDGIARFLAGTLRYFGRTTGYLLFLTDEYPPFSIDEEPDYPVAFLVPPGGPLNRLAVLFRLVLVVPASILTSLLGAGVATASAFVWLIVFVSGRLPDAVFEAESAALRFQLRFYAYAAMLTGTYPSAAFGEKPSSGGAPALQANRPLAPFTPPTPVGGFTPPTPVGGFTSPTPVGGFVPPTPVGGFAPPTPVGRWDPPAAPAAPVGAPSPYAGFAAPAPSAAPPRIRRLVLSKGARLVLVAFIVIGVVSQAASVKLAMDGSRISTVRRLDADYKDLVDASERFAAAAQRCAGSADVITCFGETLQDLDAAFVRYQHQLLATELPANALDEARTLEANITANLQALHEMETTTSLSAFQVSAQRFTQLANEFDRDWRDLREAVLSGG